MGSSTLCLWYWSSVTISSAATLSLYSKKCLPLVLMATYVYIGSLVIVPFAHIRVYVHALGWVPLDLRSDRPLYVFAIGLPFESGL